MTKLLCLLTVALISGLLVSFLPCDWLVHILLSQAPSAAQDLLFHHIWTLVSMLKFRCSSVRLLSHQLLWLDKKKKQETTCTIILGKRKILAHYYCDRLVSFDDIRQAASSHRLGTMLCTASESHASIKNGKVCFPKLLLLYSFSSASSNDWCIPESVLFCVQTNEKAMSTAIRGLLACVKKSSSQLLDTWKCSRSTHF